MTNNSRPNGAVEATAIGEYDFDEQFNTFQSFGYAANPSAMLGGALRATVHLLALLFQAVAKVHFGCEVSLPRCLNVHAELHYRSTRSTQSTQQLCTAAMHAPILAQSSNL